MVRADAKRSERAILEAAERVLYEDGGASMEQIAEAAGLTRITVHRRFASRQALIEALSISAKEQLLSAIEEARPQSAPALVALYRVTENVLRVKTSWRFTLRHSSPHSEASAAIWAAIDGHTVSLLARARGEGLLAATANLQWARQVYYSLLTEALEWPGQDDAVATPEPDVLATLVIDTLLYGAGPR
ncbi:TetR/AcrR family transcriptional regulator [Rhodococcus sp. 06-156-3C]|uniref:TetR/AcrR family transcriptional regulator n=1 Tax=Nocardiaceae TaxID=85025 RepID=UPI000522E3DF|nr:MULTISPECIES: TetR/AcrR family transcriptional regulator [Rhodococcus]OZD18362.1 TetR/AcrR family transcriptional regulator [Rhodococcus sp. 06-156-4C]OZD18960.1 TetR/AcrR family transcriptional regulator [Rhodococcus sp. 06-156-3C]OZD22473.1 TetR/AcrR family transcriptional regulator [Rhodococcus sp. 06-156-4a]OZD34174.1 TetR/AcrR family transcriptional regulator [Rhodococcus sp. 06-156-3b]OZD38911.1 TetR/AcrR family transcriptional regulator [Rhodococcus sp. 06-156-3]